MPTIKETLERIDADAPYRMVLEASVRDYCVLALKFLRGQEDFSVYFNGSLPDPYPVMEEELEKKKHAPVRYAVQMYSPECEEVLADVIADTAFAQAERLSLKAPSGPQADERERACVYIVAVYTLLALSLHSRTDFAVLFLEAWANFNAFASARMIRKNYDHSWNSRYSPLFYPLG